MRLVYARRQGCMHGFCRRQVSRGTCMTSPRDERSFVGPHAHGFCVARKSLRQWSPRSGECTMQIQVSGAMRCMLARICHQLWQRPWLAGISFPSRAFDVLGNKFIRLERHHRLRRRDCQAQQLGHRKGECRLALCSALCGLPLTAPPMQVLGTLNAHTASVESVGFCDGAAYAATASLDGRVIVWDIQVRRAVRCLCCSPACSDRPVQSISIRHICEHDAAVSIMKWVPRSLLFYRCGLPESSCDSTALTMSSHAQRCQ